MPRRKVATAFRVLRKQHAAAAAAAAPAAIRAKKQSRVMVIGKVAHPRCTALRLLFFLQGNRKGADQRRTENTSCVCRKEKKEGPEQRTKPGGWGERRFRPGVLSLRDRWRRSAGCGAAECGCAMRRALSRHCHRHRHLLHDAERPASQPEPTKTRR